MKICEKGLHTFEGHQCLECKRDYMIIWNKTNHDKVVNYSASWNKANPGKAVARAAAWNKANPKKVAAKNAAWARNNREKKIAIDTAWNKANSDKKAASASKHRAAKLQRTPKWLTTSDWIEINWAYKIASDMTKSTGVQYEVDHVVPLQGKNVSGLHCPQNLRIITKKENASKRNKF